jgi:hypothetical protein
MKLSFPNFYTAVFQASFKDSHKFFKNNFYLPAMQRLFTSWTDLSGSQTLFHIFVVAPLFIIYIALAGVVMQVIGSFAAFIHHILLYQRAKKEYELYRQIISGCFTQASQILANATKTRAVKTLETLQSIEHDFSQLPIKGEDPLNSLENIISHVHHVELKKTFLSTMSGSSFYVLKTIRKFWVWISQRHSYPFDWLTEPTFHELQELIYKETEQYLSLYQYACSQCKDSYSNTEEAVVVYLQKWEKRFIWSMLQKTLGGTHNHTLINNKINLWYQQLFSPCVPDSTRTILNYHPQTTTTPLSDTEYHLLESYIEGLSQKECKSDQEWNVLFRLRFLRAQHEMLACPLDIESDRHLAEKITKYENELNTLRQDALKRSHIPYFMTLFNRYALNLIHIRELQIIRHALCPILTAILSGAVTSEPDPVTGKTQISTNYTEGLFLPYIRHSCCIRDFDFLNFSNEWLLHTGNWPSNMTAKHSLLRLHFIQPFHAPLAKVIAVSQALININTLRQSYTHLYELLNNTNHLDSEVLCSTINEIFCCFVSTFKMDDPQVNISVTITPDTSIMISGQTLKKIKINDFYNPETGPSLGIKLQALWITLQQALKTQASQASFFLSPSLPFDATSINQCNQEITTFLKNFDTLCREKLVFLDRLSN